MRSFPENATSGHRRVPRVGILAVAVSAAAAGCDAADGDEPARAFVGATILDGTGAEPVVDGALVVRGGRIEAVGSSEEVEVPDGAEVEDLSGLHLVPGFVNAHGHVGTADGLETGAEVHTRENVRAQLDRYAHYGVTSVVSLGDPGDATLRARDEQAEGPPGRARVFTSGPVLGPDTPDEARRAVAEHAERGVDWLKIRVDDFLGRAEKMEPEVYGAVIQAGRERDLPVAAHVVERQDARELVERGAAVLAHSVRDEPVDERLLASMAERDVCLTPTLTREVSTFVYASRPDFFDDPFFLEKADPAVLRELEDPEYQRSVAESPDAAFYREALPLAEENMVATHEAGVPVALGTDSGPPGRFQGYFEHKEMEMMQEAGMDPADVLEAATGRAARCMGLEGVGTLEPGGWADLVVLEEDPTEDIRAARSIRQVWIEGRRVR